MVSMKSFPAPLPQLFIIPGISLESIMYAIISHLEGIVKLFYAFLKFFYIFHFLLDKVLDKWYNSATFSFLMVFLFHCKDTMVS